MSVPNAAFPAATTLDDIERLTTIYAKTKGLAWEPPKLNHPWLVRMIAAGFLRRCTMRCGFEAFDSGVTWTDAGHLVMRAHASAMSASGQDPKGLEAKPASATGEAGDAQP